MQFHALWSNISNKITDPEAPKASTSKGCKRCYNLDIDALCAQNQHSNVEQLLIETCDDAIGKENDHLKKEVKKLELEANKLKKQTKVQPPQDNHSNMVKKLEKGKTAPKITSQQQRKQVHHETDEKIEYTRSFFLNARRPHINSGIGYKASDKHNSRMNTRDQEFIKFTKGNIQHEKKQSIKTTNNASHVSHMSYHDFDASYVLMRNKFGKIIVLHVGPHHKRSKTCVWVPKCLVTNLRGHN
jgi:hypothetical protein